MKKLLCAILAVVLVFALCACSLPSLKDLPPLPPLPGRESAEETSAGAEDGFAAREPLTLDVVLPADSPAAREYFGDADFVGRFEAENPGLYLQLELVGREELPGFLDERLARGEAPDVVCAASLSGLVSEDLLLPVETYCPKELLDDLFPGLLDACAPDGAVRALPDQVSAGALLCNAALLADAGVSVPDSWAALEEACRAILERYDGAVIPLGIDMSDGGGWNCFACYAWGSGGGFADADGAWTLNRPENAEGVEFAVSLVNRGYTNPNPAAVSAESLLAQFAAGELAMLPTADLSAALAAARDAGIDALVSAIPSKEDGSGFILASAERIAVLRDDAAPDPDARLEAVGAFLRYYFDTERCLARAEAEGRLPALRSAAKALGDGSLARGSWAELLGSCRSCPADKSEWESVCRELAQIERLALIGGDVQAALDALQLEISP